VILILATLGLVSSKFLASKRRYAIAAMTVTAALITPGDVASTILMMGPLLLLYEISIIGWLRQGPQGGGRGEAERQTPSCTRSA
jgi:sec-independent protein translocase protein TatC